MQNVPALTSGSLPVVSYARASADKRKDEHSVEDQHRFNRQTAARYDWVVVHEFTDNDKSAAKADVVRDEFEIMLKVLRAGRLADGTPVQGVVVTADDRLVRRPGDYERFVEAITYRDGRVYADKKTGQKDLYSEDVESMGLFGAVISKMEVRKMQRRMRDSHRSRALRGKPGGGPRPFGWNADGTLNKAEADLLRKAAEDLLSGRSQNSIVSEWQRKGVETSRGNVWTVNSLKAALRAPRICGYREINGELIRGADGEPVVGQWEAIIKPSQWAAIRELYDGRKRNAPGRSIDRPHSEDYRDPTYLLSGILRCGRANDGLPCNTALRAKPQRDATYHAYGCPSKSEGGCGGVHRRGDLVDLFISEAVLAKLEEAQFTARADAGEWDKQSELDATTEQLEELKQKWISKQVTNDMFFALAPRLEREVNRLRGEKAKFEAAAAREQIKASTDVAEIRRRWFLPESEGGLPISIKRTYIRRALHAVIVYPAVRGSKRFDPDLLEPIWREE
ncbi:recombinase family protein [Thermopolyspora sp. NPDC052614]|uniref:recombinase family protein n=1 Tax=Thermopolyspora sp. NPDC052614 TaxID=3155682 RepID=UPI003422BAA2